MLRFPKIASFILVCLAGCGGDDAGDATPDPSSKGGSAGAGAGGGTSGSSGAGAAGKAGAAAAGAGGTGGGTGGAATGGSSGAGGSGAGAGGSTAGSGGTGKGGSAGTPVGGSGGGTAGTSAGGTAGTSAGGKAGTGNGGAGGKAGAGGAGAAGAGAAGAGAAGAGAAGANAGAGGGSGAAGSGGAAGAGGGVGSTGCGAPTSEPAKTWTPKTTTIAGAKRDYFVYLPAGYDANKAYPVVYQFHGCSSSANKETNNVPVQDQSGTAAIHVRGRAVGDCWDTAKTGPDVLLFDAMVGEVEAAYCADPTRRFVTGYSSGSFMTHQLACVRGDQIRGVASIAGGQPGSGCKSPVAALLIHDADDTTVNISASVNTRDWHLKQNTCGTTTSPFAPAPCQAYAGCAAGLPVVWCQTAGKNHSRQDSLAAPAFWNFLSAL